MGLEEFLEDRLVGKVELIDYLLDGITAVTEKILSLKDNIRIDPVRRGLSTLPLDNLRKIFGRNA